MNSDGTTRRQNFSIATFNLNSWCSPNKQMVLQMADFKNPSQGQRIPRTRREVEVVKGELISASQEMKIF